MKGLKKTQLLYLSILILALVLTHINVLELVMGSERFVLYSVEKTLKSEAFHFEARFMEAEQVLPIYVKGEKNNQLVHITVMSDMAILLQIQYNLDSGEFEIDEGMLDIPKELFNDQLLPDMLSGLYSSNTDLLEVFGSWDIEKVKSHQVIDQSISNTYMVSNNHELAINYIGHIKQITTSIQLGDSEMGVEITLY